MAFMPEKVGAYLSRLRKEADMTQSELADRLNLTRQAISRYELGLSFPDVTILVSLADVFGVTVDDIIRAGGPTGGEARLLAELAEGREPDDPDGSDVAGLAPLLKPSTLERLTGALAKRGIDISRVTELASYLSDASMKRLLASADYGAAEEELLEKLLPFLDEGSREVVFDKILNGELPWTMLRPMRRGDGQLVSRVEAAVIDGALPYEALGTLRGWEKEEDE